MYKSTNRAAVAVALIGTLAGCFILPKEEQRIPPPAVLAPEIKYNTTPVVRDILADVVEVLAYFQPAEEHPLFFGYAGGRVKEVYCELGERVAVGQLLAELDVPSLASAYKKQLLLLEKAELILERLRAAGADRFQVRSAEIDVALGIIDRDDLARSIASAALVSPIDGVIVYRAGIEKGDSVERYRTIIRVADLDSLQLVYSGGSAKRFRTGMEVMITIGNETFNGVVLTSPEDVPVDAPSSERDRLVFGPSELPDGVERGDLASIRAVLWEKKGVIAISSDFIHTYKETPFVNVLRDGVKREQPVEIGVTTSSKSEIVEGLREGDLLLR